jgi:hypothetical protein
MPATLAANVTAAAVIIMSNHHHVTNQAIASIIMSGARGRWH